MRGAALAAVAGTLLAVTSAAPPARAQDYRAPFSDADYGYFYVTAYYDHSGVDWNCGGLQYSGHRGSDYGAGGFSGMYAGRDLVAAADGVVVAAHDGEFDECTTGNCSGGGGYGNYVMIQHANGRTTVYAHMRIWTVSVGYGQQVSCGQYLGQMGSSGYSTGPHLHFEVRESNSSRVDPYDGPCSGPPSYWVGQGSYGGLPSTSCDGPSCECTPGQVQGQACGNCGWQERTCGGDCQWGGWGTCSGQGVCSPGASEVQACCDCGTQARSCDGSCQWGGWSACAGPDPDGGTQWCDTGESGPCAEGRMRCVEGCLDCVRIYEPIPELCDTVDNDCNGAVDDGDPAEMGDPVPAFSARLVDASYPATLPPGGDGLAWAEFENVGAETWRSGHVYLGSLAAAGGQPSALYAEGAWPAWDIAAVLDEDVAPGGRGFLPFTVAAPPEAGEDVAEAFRLMDPEGRMLDCPSPGVTLEIRVRGGDADDGGQLQGDSHADPVSSAEDDGDGGCRCRHGTLADDGTPRGGLAWVGALAAAVLLRRRRREEHR